MQGSLNPNAQSYNRLPPGEGALAWECSDYVVEKFTQHGQHLPHLLRILKDMQKTLEKSRVAYNQALQERDDERARLVEAENRLSEVQRVVQRYAGVAEPVVASDGFTYEKSVIQGYLDDCKNTETNAYSQQTKEVLTNCLVTNQSLKKLVEMLKVVKPNEVAPAQKAAIIPPYRATASNGVNFLEEESSKKPKGAIHASDLEAAFKTEKSDGKRESDKKHSKEQEPREGRPEKEERHGKKGGQLHPCMRVYGFCNFKEDCTFAKYPYESCLNYIKGKCRFGDQCKELHVNLKDTKYTNPRANPQSAVKDEKPQKSEKETKEHKESKESKSKEWKKESKK